MAVLPTGIGPVTGGYQIERSLRFNSADTPSLSRTPGSAGNRQKFTISVWYKACGISTSPSNANIINAGGDGSSLLISGTAAFGATYDNRLLFREAGTTLFYWPMVFRDPSAWYHIVFAMDTTQATAANRAKLYVNGVDQGAFSGTAISQNTSTSINNTSAHSIGLFNGAYPNNLYYAEYYLIDGQALTPSSFGETDSATGVWKPKAYSGTYGTNGFYLKFADNSGTTSTTLGKDSSGNGNNWTPNNFSVTAGAGNDSLVDTPTPYGSDTGAGGEVRGNYCTLNPLQRSSATLSNGNLDLTSATLRTGPAIGTISVDASNTHGFYYEVVPTQGAVTNYYLGWAQDGYEPYNSNPSNTVGFIGIVSDGSVYANASYIGAVGTSWTNNDVIGIGIKNGGMYVSKNGTLMNSGNPLVTGLTGTWKPYLTHAGSATPVFAANTNFGQRPWQYAPPSGFKALCTQNLPTPTIGATSTTQAGKYFDVKTYTGDGTSPKQVVTGLGFQPDLIWSKDRNLGAFSVLYDAVRGVGSNKALSSGTTDPEGLGTTAGSPATFGYISSINSDGYTATSGSTNNNYHNANTATYVGWAWKANGAGSTNTAGTITSTVSANTTAGFSIATFNAGSAGNKTVGHGLGVAPSFWITKCRSTGGTSWSVGSKALTTPASNYLSLNLTSASTSDTRIWANAAPTSTVFSFESGYTLPANSNCVAYCFAEVAGYSAFGSYTGNGSADGPFVFTNHRPAFLLIKRTDTTSNWTILDLAREGYNVDNDPLYPNLSDAEGTTDLADILSNGFKLRSTDTSVNANTGTYVYMSLAANPFKYSLAR